MNARFPGLAANLVLAVTLIATVAPADDDTFAVRTLQLRELWRTGGNDDGLMFGVVSQILCDDEGLVYLLDRQLAQVPVMAPDGTHVRTVGRAGEGPGEVRRPQDMIFFPDGRLGVAKAHPGSIVGLDRDGLPAGTFRLGVADSGHQGGHGLTGIHAATCRGGNLVLDCSRAMPGDGGQESNLYLASFDPEGKELCRYFETTLSMDFGDCHMSEAADDRPRAGRWTVGPDGRVYVASQRNAYQIEVYAPDGVLVRTIERDYRSLMRSDAETAVIREYYEDFVAQLPGSCEYEFEPTRPDIETLYVFDDGRLWVRTSRSGHHQPAGTILALDEFGPGGEYRGQVRIPGVFDADRDFFFLPGHGYLVVVVGGREARLAQRGTPLPPGPERDVEAMTVICLKIEE
ncbi:MAG: hypothetical protein GY838_05550 [bacterium]|nr:hypothetical protein [bacterium]